MYTEASTNGMDSKRSFFADLPVFSTLELLKQSQSSGKSPMVQTPAKSLSLDEFLKLPETKPASEYIDGQIIQKPMPQGKHSRLQNKLATAINECSEQQKLALALPELRCSFGVRSIVPDVAVFQWHRIPIDEDGDIANAFDTCPDWTIEILSPDQSPTKVINNILYCLNAGCQMGWLIDPQVKSIQIYPAKQQPIALEEPNDRLLVPEFCPQLSLTLGDVFGWLTLSHR
jgi:Uma2 family endonuclease